MREVYLDNAATMKKHLDAINSEAKFYRKINANPLRGLYKKSVQATTGVNEAREAVLKLVHADKSYTPVRDTTLAPLMSFLRSLEIKTFEYLCFQGKMFE